MNGRPGGDDRAARPDPAKPLGPQTGGKTWDRSGLGRLSACRVAEALRLEPHPEGGFFRETYRAVLQVQTAAGVRPVSTSILYLLTEDSPSRFHRLAFDELWFYHAGDPAELWLLAPTTGDAPAPERTSAHIEGSPPGRVPVRETVGPENPSTLVPARWWMGARVLTDERRPMMCGRRPMADDRRPMAAGWTLVSCVVTPGFAYEDFELADGEDLLRDYPACRDLILMLT